MENLGYKEGSTKPKAAGKRRMSRARASIVENESLPLSLTPRYFNYHLLNQVDSEILKSLRQPFQRLVGGLKISLSTKACLRD